MTLRSLLRHETILALLTVIVLIILSFQSDKFFTVANLLNQGRLMTEVGLVAVAMTFIIITGGIDLSVGSIIGLTAILLGVFWQKLGMPLPLAMFAAVCVGTLGGYVNGLIITRFNVPPLIATLATLALYRGTRRRHFRSPFRARLSGLVLRARSGQFRGPAEPALDLAVRDCHCRNHPGAHKLGPDHLRDWLE